MNEIVNIAEIRKIGTENWKIDANKWKYFFCDFDPVYNM